MLVNIKEPQNRISSRAIRVWIISEVIQNIIGFAVLGVLFYLNDLFSWKEWIGWVLIILLFVSIPAAIWSFISPFIKYKSWRYDVDEEYVQMKSGVWQEKHLLIPMTKVQSVETVQGPIMRKYGLYSVTMGTMGSSHTIPALPEGEAVSLRNQIAKYAKIKEEDE
ncbi:PH domain-containing protein [Cytobacillus firmus]|uniref:PH domain-containing protein n=1 Tax=Cytobacillus firmus TaxID=1399 RepID=UPI0018CE4507|nr:PH domain-containing protein [Cytobacillus firmus]MBG9446003.1 bacterial membrane flanked domain protein [Cytobacillus firmus]MBG9586383.1 bacterial membrane flanked domain protein [Cytobacillus firmus]URT71408.1 PH domain-containing protein [Cytobacillus firmus]